MSDKQDHHYIPQFLLRGWCNQSGRLTVYSRQQKRIATSTLNPRSTAFEPNLYTYEQVPPEKRNAIENDFMGRIDAAAALIVQKMLNGGLPNLAVEERSDFTRFLLSLRARHPDAVALMKVKGQEGLIAALERDPEEYEAARGRSSAATLAEWTRQNAPSLIQNFGVSLVPGVIIDDRTGAHVFNMPWWTHDLRDANTDLLLSDRPCLLEGDAIAGQCVIALPLSPVTLFLACNRRPQMQVLRSMPVTRLVKTINRASVGYAASRIYSTGAHHLPLIKKYFQ